MGPHLDAEHLAAFVDGSLSRAERAALHGRQLLEKQSTRFFRYLGIVLTLAGFGGFVLFQI